MIMQLHFCSAFERNCVESDDFKKRWIEKLNPMSRVFNQSNKMLLLEFWTGLAKMRNLLILIFGKKFLRHTCADV